MIDDAPRPSVPLKPVRRCRQVRPVEQHPHEAIVLELLRQLHRRLQELVPVVDPRRLDKTAHREHDRRLFKVVRIYKERTRRAVAGRQQRRAIARVLQVIGI